MNHEKAKPRKRDPSESSNDDDDDDDLDAPIRSRLHPISNGSTTFTMTPSSHVIQQEPKNYNLQNHEIIYYSELLRATDDDIDDTLSHVSINARERIAKRLEQARLRRVKEEQEARKKLEIIPMFLHEGTTGATKLLGIRTSTSQNNISLQWI